MRPYIGVAAAEMWCYNQGMDERSQQQHEDAGVRIEQYRGPMTQGGLPPDVQYEPLLKDAPAERFLDAPLNLPPVPVAYLQEEVLPPRPTGISSRELDRLNGYGLGLSITALGAAVYFIFSFRNPQDPFLGLGLMRQLMPMATLVATMGLICNISWAVTHPQADSKARRINWYIILAEGVLITFTLLEWFGWLTV